MQTALRPLFIGGPGRSGTSFVADRLGRHPQIAAFRDVELKIFCERGGLYDLHEVLTRSYSPNRAAGALAQFARMAEAVVAGRYGQRGFEGGTAAEGLRHAFGAFGRALTSGGQPAPLGEARFVAAARALLDRLARLAAAECGGAAGRRVFLEKTPHNLLFADFLARLAPGAAFLHVMRDPRAIAWSLLAQRWAPDDCAATAAWVAGYCAAWERAEARIAASGFPVLRLHIESLAASPRPHARLLCRHLGLTPRPALFDGADPATLSRWRNRAEAGDLRLLGERLDGWAARFGYDRARIGNPPRRRLGRPLAAARPHPLPAPLPLV